MPEDKAEMVAVAVAVAVVVVVTSSLLLWKLPTWCEGFGIL
jgi:hypothetical protein